MKLWKLFSLLFASVETYSFSTAKADFESFHLDENIEHEMTLEIEGKNNTGVGDISFLISALVTTSDELNQSSRPSTYSDIGGPIFVTDHGELSLREFYWDFDILGGQWRVGKQQVVWGEADGIKILDVVNPQSFREFVLDDFDDSRIPLTMINAEWMIGNSGNLQLLYIFDTSVHDLPDPSSPFNFSSELIVPAAGSDVLVNVQPFESPDVNFDNSDIGIRYSGFVNGWDYSINYLNHVVDFPVFQSQLSGNVINVEGEYLRSDLLGVTGSSAIGSWVIRGEIAFEKDRYFLSSNSLPRSEKSDTFASVFGIDWLGWRNQFLSLQWFNNSLLTDIETVRDDSENTLSFLWELQMMNESIKLEYLQLQSVNYADGLIQFQISYEAATDLEVYFGSDIFYGNSRYLYGQFNQNDQVTIGMSLGF